MKKTLLDDGFQAYLTKGAELVGEAGIPMLLNLDNVQIPKGLIPFNKIGTEKDKSKYVHFYIHDYQFSQILTSTTKYINKLKEFDGVITPDCSMLINQAQCLQQTNTYFNRAIGFYLQKQGIPVIPNIRWSDEKSFNYCFLGVPKHSIVCVSTHGCIRSKKEKDIFKLGLKEMLFQIEPKAVIVHGYMPNYIFNDFYVSSNFYRFPSEFELTHKKKDI
jgi:hypothetical protein